jgi:hypothetical protein
MSEFIHASLSIPVKLRRFVGLVHDENDKGQSKTISQKNKNPINSIIIMNFSIAFLFFVLSFHSVNAYDILRILLNNGRDFYCMDRWNNCCSSTEWDTISKAVYAMAKNQRHTRRTLRGNITNHNDAMIVEGTSSNSIPTGNNTDVHRELPSYPGSCANNCRGYTTGRCMALNCVGYRQRRSMMESFTSLVGRKHDRDLFWATGCDTQKQEANNLLTNIQSQVGPRCKALLNAPRGLKCYSTANC